MSDHNKNEVPVVSLSSVLHQRVEQAATQTTRVSLDHTASLLKASTLMRQFDQACRQAKSLKA